MVGRLRSFPFRVCVMRDLRPSACPTPEIHILRLVQSPGSLSSNILRSFLPVGKDFTNQAANFLPVGKPFSGPPAWKTKGPAVGDAGWRDDDQVPAGSDAPPEANGRVNQKPEEGNRKYGNQKEQRQDVHGSKKQIPHKLGISFLSVCPTGNIHATASARKLL